MTRPTPLLALLLLCAPGALAQSESPLAPVQKPTEIEVTATRIPEDPAEVPAAVTVVGGDELRARGARTVGDALALAAGVDVAPGGDAGPGAFVPEIRGLREFDAFLLVVDGVPWGGAFVPSVSAVSLDDVERIEILRGPAPVFYGATSFSGVIHVVHRGSAASGSSALLSTGSFGSHALSYAGALPLGPVRSRVAVSAERQGFADPRTRADRLQARWDNEVRFGEARASFSANATWLRQLPASPTPRVGRELTTLVPRDTNQNPLDAHVNERRIEIAAGLVRPLGAFEWTTTVSLARTDDGVLRGFLVDVTEDAPNAHGFRQATRTDDVFLDTHVARRGRAWSIVGGVDWLHGRGRADGGDFDYAVALDGGNAPDGSGLPSAAAVSIADDRDFAGLYGNVEWRPAERWRVDAGVRLNHTRETRGISALEFESGGAFAGSSARSANRLSGSLGITWTAWQRAADAVRVYASARDSFKPAVIDFGLDSDPAILEPETARTYEAGVKGRWADGAFEAGLALFRTDFENLVVAATRDGLPVLENAGSERFRGLEAEAAARIAGALSARVAYALHDSTFVDYLKEFDPGVPTQLAGKTLEMTARHTGSVGLVLAPARGWTGSVAARYVGPRFLNMRNTARVGGYTRLDAGAGYRFDRWELRVDGTNLTDKREPVAESELGDAQYYLLPARTVSASVNVRF